MPARQSRPRSTRNAKPSFEVVRGAFEETQTGWVYRSDARAEAIEPPRIKPVWPAPEPVDHAWSARHGHAAPREHFSPEHATPASSSRGWIETSLLLMALPMAITAGMMLAPMIWMCAPRRR